MSDIEFALNTMYLLFSGALVMWMAAGFTMLEAGLVRSKNVSEIVTKNIGLYSIACIMYLICGFYIMYPGDSAVNNCIPPTPKRGKIAIVKTIIPIPPIQ